MTLNIASTILLIHNDWVPKTVLIRLVMNFILFTNIITLLILLNVVLALVGLFEWLILLTFYIVFLAVIVITFWDYNLLWIDLDIQIYGWIKIRFVLWHVLLIFNPLLLLIFKWSEHYGWQSLFLYFLLKLTFKLSLNMFLYGVLSYYSLFWPI
jgi:hypothetical protein